MLNSVNLMGRITAPLELKATKNGTHVLPFSIAIDRSYTNSNGERQTDFIDCVAYRQTAEFIARYFSKGNMICVEGTLTTRRYTTQNGEKRRVTEVLVDKAHFTGGNKKADTGNASGLKNDFSELDVPDDYSLPF